MEWTKIDPQKPETKLPLGKDILAFNKPWINDNDEEHGINLIRVPVNENDEWFEEKERVPTHWALAEPPND